MPQRRTDQYGSPRTRYVYPNNRNGYYVKLPAAAGFKPRYFGATRHGNIGAAYNAALAWRDQYLTASQSNRVLRNDGRTYTSYGAQNRRRFSLGKSGITLKTTASQSIRRGAYFYARASIRKPGSGSPMCRDFSIERYGLETALRYALRKRLEWERAFYGHASRISDDDWLEFMLLCHKQHGTKAISLDDITHPGAITHPDATNTQARLMVRRKQYSACFSYYHYGSRHEADVAAIVWLIHKHAQLNPSGGYRVLDATRRNKTTGVAGVSRTVCNDRRGKPVVAYQVSVKADGKRTSMSFAAGRLDVVTPEQEAFTRDIAIRCRQAYEHAHDTGQPFDRSQWRGWKKCFGFPAAPSAAEMESQEQCQ